MRNFDWLYNEFSEISLRAGLPVVPRQLARTGVFVNVFPGNSLLAGRGAARIRPNYAKDCSRLASSRSSIVRSRNLSFAWTSDGIAGKTQTPSQTGNAWMPYGTLARSNTGCHQLSVAPGFVYNTFNSWRKPSISSFNRSNWRTSYKSSLVLHSGNLVHLLVFVL